MSTYRTVNSLHNHTLTGVRSRIIYASRHLFAAKGYAGTSLREIALAARVTKPMVYYYFGNKEGLYRAIVAELTSQLQARLQLAARGPSGHDKLLAAARAFAQLGREQAETVGLITHVDPTAPAAATLERFFALLVRPMLAEAVERQEIRDVDPALFAIMLSQSLVVACKRGHDPDAIVDLLWRGVAPRVTC